MTNNIFLNKVLFLLQNESKAQVWAFLLWKCSSVRDGSTVNTDNSWKLYQQWCRMAEAQRTAWITAGSNVQALSKFAHAKVVSIISIKVGHSKVVREKVGPLNIRNTIV